MQPVISIKATGGVIIRPSIEPGLKLGVAPQLTS